jgi:hypothetical protein
VRGQVFAAIQHSKNCAYYIPRNLVKMFFRADHIVGDFGFGELLGFGEGEVDGGALDSDEAPTPGECDVLGCGGEGFNAAAHEFAVAFVPGTSKVLR